eukprot:CAMPEP_0196758608 /NCGR_PEP_ID=MMETSP1091-20130531/104276_1 /TAXON_ID=302021 /ORGANISM="Rhodomonas sp., Strain CCMP768" /LENGTH=380 /DNA_ID=CAMNT_0042107437 /DNA_START=35 /DNA_END=1179 /DNA_ORIENTATION=+
MGNQNGGFACCDPVSIQPPHGQGGQCCWEPEKQQPVKVKNRKVASAKTQHAKSLDKELNTGTDLHKAAGTGDERQIQELVAKGADVNVRDAGGRTPFFLACKFGKLNTAKDLLRRGANATIPDNQGRTAHDVSSGAVKEFLNRYRETGRVSPTLQFHHVGSLTPTRTPRGSLTNDSDTRMPPPMTRRLSEETMSVARTVTSEDDTPTRKSSFPFPFLRRRSSVQNPFSKMSKETKKNVYTVEGIDVPTQGTGNGARRERLTTTMGSEEEENDAGRGGERERERERESLVDRGERELMTDGEVFHGGVQLLEKMDVTLWLHPDGHRAMKFNGGGGVCTGYGCSKMSKETKKNVYTVEGIDVPTPGNRQRRPSRELDDDDGL